MAINHYYVDPASGDDTTGSGTKLSPWKSLAKAYATASAPAVGSTNQINLKSGTADVLTASLSTVPGGTDKLWKVRGYTTDENDGGIGEIDGDGSYNIDFQTGGVFQDLKIGNTGANAVINGNYADNTSYLINCEIYGSTVGGISFSNGHTYRAINCYIHDIAGYGIYTIDPDTLIYGCFFRNGATNKFTDCVAFASPQVTVTKNMAWLDADSDGFRVGAGSGVISCQVIGNSIFSDGGTGTGIGTGLTNGYGQVVMNNLIQGFSGTGGIGLQNVAGAVSNPRVCIVRSNAIADCETPIDYEVGDVNPFQEPDNETVTSGDLFAMTPLPDSSLFVSDNAAFWAQVRAFFAPTNVGNVIGGAF